MRLSSLVSRTRNASRLFQLGQKVLEFASAASANLPHLFNDFGLIEIPEGGCENFRRNRDRLRRIGRGAHLSHQISVAQSELIRSVDTGYPLQDVHAENNRRRACLIDRKADQVSRGSTRDFVQI